MALNDLPSIDWIDREMHCIVSPDTVMTEIASGRRFTEGPVWVPQIGAWIFSDIPADTLFAWSSDGGLREYRYPSYNANGNTLDREGRLVTCEHGLRRVTRTEHDGSITVLASTYAGRRLNSPNDVVVKSDGTIWFTDPPYGIRMDQREQPGHYVYRLDPGSSEPTPVALDFAMPNGLCFTPDETTLYVADSSDRRHVRRFQVTAENSLIDEGVFAVIRPHVPDGLCVDIEGRVFCTAGDGVQVFRSDGQLIGKFLTPEVAANCALGGPNGRELLITACTSVWRVSLRSLS